jgi:hypothetical protein
MNPQALELLTSEDARLDRGVRRRSLSPNKERASSLVEIARALDLAEERSIMQLEFARGLAEWTRSQQVNFPENLFWDFDYPAACVLRCARSLSEGADLDSVATTFGRMVELQQRYGVHTTIRFRYVHDFSYGLDWAKWIARSDDQDGSVGPFDWEFLTYLRHRAFALVELIERDDKKYPTLKRGAARNPFPFLRDPESEARILAELAHRGQLPVCAWDANASPRFDMPFQALRLACAEELGLTSEG